MNPDSKDNIDLHNYHSGQIVNAAMKVHRRLGPGLLESTYEVCLLHELRNRGISVKSQVGILVEYDSVKLDVGYRVDMLVEESIIVELKAVNKILPIHNAQLMSYLKLSDLRLGLLINFNTISLRDGIKRIINGY